MSDMRYIAAAIVVGFGLVGLHFGVEYSGWAVATGCLCLVMF